MPDYGWAYINLDALSTLNGPTGSLAFRNGSQALSGTAAFIYATASHKIGVGINVPGALTPATLPSYILDVSASVGDTTAFRTIGDIQVSGNAYVSGTLAVESLHAHTVISSSNLIVRDPLIGMGFGDGANETGSVGDRGLILGLAGDLNQAILWDQTSGSFVIGKVGAQGPDKTAFDIPDGNLSTVRLGYLTASNTVSASEYHGDGSKLTGLADSAVTSYTNAADNRIITSVDSSTINAEQKLTFDGSKFLVDGAISGSNTLEAVGNAFLGGDVNVSGTVKVTGKIERAGDTDTFINFTDDDINFQAGGVNFLDFTEDDSQDEVTFNEGGVDIDFRVETADESHMLFVEGSSNRMSIGDNTGSPGATLEIKNHATAGATGVPLLQLNSNDTDEIALDINAGNIDANVVDILANDVTTAKVINVSADGLTTGNALYVADDSANTGTRKTALVIQNNAAALNATALHVQSDGGVTGVNIDKNYSDTAEASITGLNIDWDKTGASTTDNTMFGIQVDMDNTTATNGLNTMYGLYVTPTLTHAANAGTPVVYGALINAQGGTNGTSLVQGARIEAGGGDINYGIQLDVEDGGVDLRIESSADSGDYFQIQTTTAGATTFTTVDDNATAAHLTMTVDGDITLDPAGGDVFVDGNVSGSGTFQAVGAAILGNNLTVSGTVAVTSKIEHVGDTDTHLKFDTDKIEFIAGNETLLTLTEDTQDIVTVGDGGDVDFQVKTSTHNHTIFAQGDKALVGIRSSAPTAVLHLSESGASQIGMPRPMFRIDHPGDASGKEFTEALFCVTASIPDDYFEARVGVNTKTPEGAFHVKTQEGQNTFLVVDDKVVIGNNNASSKFQVRKSIGNAGDRDVMLIESILNDDDTVHNLFYATGSTDGSGVFGSFNTGSALKVSGSSFMTSMHVQYSGTNQDTNVGPRDYIFGVDTSGGSPKIFLESAAVAGKGRKIVVKDTGNNAGSNNIKITGSTAGDLIEYAAETLVNANKAAKTLVSDGVSKWFVIASG